MNQNSNNHLGQTELEASLARLGIRELEERMEISPLLAGDGIQEMDKEGPSICCTCKIPDPFGPDGSLPYPSMDPGPLTSTGPTNPNGLA